MKIKLFRVSIALTLVVALAVGAFFLADRAKEKEAALEPEFPTALGKHIEKLAEAIPGQGGEPSEGPGSYEDYQFNQLAYPGTDIPLNNLEAMRAADKILKNQKLPVGKGRPGTWVSVGPSDALYRRRAVLRTRNRDPRRRRSAGPARTRVSDAPRTSAAGGTRSGPAEPPDRRV